MRLKPLGMRRLRSSDPRDPPMDHRKPAPGQRVHTLCGWEGGREIEYVDDGAAEKCADCEAIYRWARGR